MRIVTRPDFDGVVCAVLLHAVEKIDKPVKWIQPSKVQAGLANINGDDILANLPYDDRCGMWFDHHYTNRIDHPFKGAFRIAPSAARVVYEYYQTRFSNKFNKLVDAADKIDSADLTRDEVLKPEKHPYILLSMTLTDIGNRHDPYWDRLVRLLGREPLKNVINDPEVVRRCRRVVEEIKTYRELLEKHSRLDSHVTITDFRGVENVPEGNRFLVYSMFPEAVVSMRIKYADGEPDTVRVSVGHSIFNRNCQVNVGLMLADFNGGGHKAAGGCSFPADRADEFIPKMIEILLENRSNEPDPE